MEQSPPNPPHIAIVPSPGMGHLIPLIELAKRLVHRHSLHVTFLVPTDGPPSASARSVLSALPSSIRHLFLPPVSFSDIPTQDLRIETLISLTVTRSLPSLRAALSSLPYPVAAVVVDLFATDAFDAAAEAGAAPYVFFPSTAMALSFLLRLPELDATISGEYRHHPEPIAIPGCIPIRGSELLDPVQDRANDAYRRVLHNARRYRMAEGIMVNSFAELEPGAVKALQSPEEGKPPVYPVGPLVKGGSGPAPGVKNGPGSECLRWLEEQPAGSVLFVSFGSGGTLSGEQLKELALGLEMSEQRFLWVARSPSDESANATYFSAESKEDPARYLPGGFLERVRGRGLVVPSWAPQAEVLAHGSTGGFLTHCGWNSTLESVVYGVPLIAWPLYAEQKMNAAMVTEGLRVALRPRAADGGIIERAEIARVVKGLMEGEEGKGLRNRMKELKEAAAMVVGEDGSSTKALAELAHKWQTRSPTRERKTQGHHLTQQTL